MRRFNAAHCRALLLVLLGSTAAPALAQAAADSAAARRRRRDTAGRTYTPADFARFAPRNALDMLNNVPGFAIDEKRHRAARPRPGDRQRADQRRALLRQVDRHPSPSCRRISASNVARIEIVDGATLNISGLTGQVANIITPARPFRQLCPGARNPRPTAPRSAGSNGEVSVNGTIGGTKSRLSLRNNSFRNGNAGPEW